MRRQLALTAAAVATMIVMAFLLPLGILVRSIAEDRALNVAERAAQTLAPVLVTVRDEIGLSVAVEAVNSTDVGDVSVVLTDDTVIGAPTTVDANIELARTGRAFSTGVEGGTLVLIPVVLTDGRADVVQVFVDEERLRVGVTTAWLLLALLGVTLVLIAVVLADRLARGIVRPIDELAEVAERLGQGDLDARVEPTGPAEVAEVGHILNQLATRIEGLLSAQRESVADLSHRLRTPVTALRLDVDAMTDPEERARVGADVDALTRAVDRLITDARHPVRAGAAQRSDADLVAITNERAQFWAALAEDQNRQFTLDVPEQTCVVAVGPDELGAVLDAILNNVLAHTPEGVGFEMAVRPIPTGGGVLVCEDSGPGWPADRDVLARGHSGGHSTGLGLDIVRATAEASGGSVNLNRSSTGGARLEVVLGPPRADPNT